MKSTILLLVRTIGIAALVISLPLSGWSFGMWQSGEVLHWYNKFAMGYTATFFLLCCYKLAKTFEVKP
jgi:hypothetical protein